MAIDLEDYNDVSSRMREFFDKYPDGSLQTDVNLTEVAGRPVAVAKAHAYRHPEDPKPGQGHAYEFIPGSTPYTKDSELQNAETAAWGRAIMAVGAADSRKGIASREEVRNRQTLLPKQSNPDNLEGQQVLLKVCENKGVDAAAVAEAFQARFGKHPRFSGNDELMAFALLVDEGAVTLGVG